MLLKKYTVIKWYVKGHKAITLTGKLMLCFGIFFKIISLWLNTYQWEVSQTQLSYLEGSAEYEWVNTPSVLKHHYSVSKSAVSNPVSIELTKRAEKKKETKRDKPKAFMPFIDKAKLEDHIEAPKLPDSTEPHESKIKITKHDS